MIDMNQIASLPALQQAANVEVVRTHLIEIWQNGRHELADSLFHPDFVDHNPLPGQRPGHAGLIDSARFIKAAFPDHRYEVLMLLPVGDLVIDHWIFRGRQDGPLGDVPPTGKPVEFRGTDILRIVDGRIREIWHVEELMTMYQQLGLVQPPA